MCTVPCDTGISQELLLFKTHEPIATQLLIQTLKPGMICLDIGANIGYYVLLERKIVGVTGKVVAIEPSPIAFNYLRKNLEINKFDNVEIHRLAMAGEVLFVPFIIDEKSNLSRVADGSPNEAGGVTAVPAQTLDSFVEAMRFSKLDLIRMDVEGYEDIILTNGRAILRRYKPSLLIEVHASKLGPARLKRFVFNLQAVGYSSSYFIERNHEVLGVFRSASKIEIKELRLSQIIDKMVNHQLPNVFTLLIW
jgi:FkbM family methyltransferase